ncbi:hypothetical protein B0H16DRAFT_51301 [Mycena metata]|uniref:Uncharacterized protein n=1 Tax=Mycena metata TaxID=1033252 RepID=A0AAD7N0E5_9AGAR|nr:hypothetical protein B0H16DRAFT_51301 [Mycena metata]
MLHICRRELCVLPRGSRGFVRTEGLGIDIVKLILLPPNLNTRHDFNSTSTPISSQQCRGQHLILWLCPALLLRSRADSCPFCNRRALGRNSARIIIVECPSGYRTLCGEWKWWIGMNRYGLLRPPTHALARRGTIVSTAGWWLGRMSLWGTRAEGSGRESRRQVSDE